MDRPEEITLEMLNVVLRTAGTIIEEKIGEDTFEVFMDDGTSETFDGVGFARGMYGSVTNFTKTIVARAEKAEAERDALQSTNDCLTDALSQTPSVPPSVVCSKFHWQACHGCDNAECGDNNTESIVAIKKERDALQARVRGLEEGQPTESLRKMVEWIEVAVRAGDIPETNFSYIKPDLEWAKKLLSLSQAAPGWEDVVVNADVPEKIPDETLTEGNG